MRFGPFEFEYMKIDHCSEFEVPVGWPLSRQRCLVGSWKYQCEHQRVLIKEESGLDK